jgi:hypothetical protein
MSQDPFEADLERMFSAVPEATDADAFAARLEARLGRRGALRGWALAGSGALGVAVAAPQLAALAAGASGQPALWAGVVQALHGAAETALAMGGPALAPLQHMPIGQGLPWMAMALVALVAAAAARALQDA